MATHKMLKDYLLRLEDRQLPQRLVAWLLQRRSRVRLSQLLSPSQNSEGAHAVSLGVAHPLKSSKILIEGLVPRTFGAWRDFQVVSSCVGTVQVVAILRDAGAGTEFTLVLPKQAKFPLRTFRRTKVLRLTCEAPRASLLSVRNPQGSLIAAGVLEISERAAFSKELL